MSLCIFIMLLQVILILFFWIINFFLIICCENHLWKSSVQELWELAQLKTYWILFSQSSKTLNSFLNSFLGEPDRFFETVLRTGMDDSHQKVRTAQHWWGLLQILLWQKLRRFHYKVQIHSWVSNTRIYQSSTKTPL